MRRRMAQHPNAVRFDEARRVLEAFDWRLDHVRGSHHVFARGGARLTIPLRRPSILPVYVRQVLRATEVDDGDSEVRGS
jgi:predicted RNA binding protein YcfA (HicA-like mRNA interferase family)